jgi:hypothetical protein
MYQRTTHNWLSAVTINTAYFFIFNNHPMKYKLIKSIIPEIKGSTVTNDPKVGGIKLTYEIGETKLFKKLNEPKQIVHFIRLYKKHLGKDKNSLTKEEQKRGDWGNTTSPLSTVWMKSVIDCKNFQEAFNMRNPNFNINFVYGLERVTDESLIAYLNKAEKEFTIETGQSKSPKRISKYQSAVFQIKSLIKR